MNAALQKIADVHGRVRSAWRALQDSAEMKELESAERDRQSAFRALTDSQELIAWAMDLVPNTMRSFVVQIDVSFHESSAPRGEGEDSLRIVYLLKAEGARAVREAVFAAVGQMPEAVHAIDAIVFHFAAHFGESP